MYAFQVVEDGDDKIEILNEYGVELLLTCFKEDFGNYADLLSKNSNVKKAYWNCDDFLNWDYLLSGAQELRWYCGYMENFAEEVGDKQAKQDLAIACELIEDLEEIISEILSFTAGNVYNTVHNLDEFNFWREQLYNIIYIEQAIDKGVGLMGSSGE